MQKLTLSLFAALLMCGVSVFAQEEESTSTPLEISGSIDTYYRTTLNTDDNGDFSAPGTSFANGTGFNIGMANVVFSMEGEKSGFVGDLVFGPRGDDAVFGSVLPGNNDGIVNQLYAYWMPSETVTLTIGNFNTFLGYEVISPAANFNYSTSYMFSYGPFSHTGLKADIALSDNLSLMGAVMNPTDATTTTDVNTPTLGFQLGYTNDMGGAWLNVLYGDQDGAIDPEEDSLGTFSAGSSFQIDLTTGWDLSDAFYLGFNTTFFSGGTGSMIVEEDGEAIEEDVDGDASTFYGAALYLQYALSDNFALGARGEYFGETAGGAGAIGAYDENGDASVIDLTLSANYSVGNLTFIPEFRIDLYSEDAVLTKDDEAASSLSSVSLAAVYAF